jgi:hypothetical protein
VVSVPTCGPWSSVLLSPDVPCPEGTLRCGNDCVNTQSDATNCGSCGAICGTDQFCEMGDCVGGVECTVEGDTCTGSSDTSCCGGLVCQYVGPGYQCVAGEACQTGLTDCDGYCVNLLGDRANCGTCGTACGTGQVCLTGTCTTVPACKTPGMPCSGTSDTSCCGTCEIVVSNYQCVGTCADRTQTECPIFTGTGGGGGYCVNTLVDANNCGACGNACVTGSTCQMGACCDGMYNCTCAAGQTLCGTGMAEHDCCTADETCEGGYCVQTGPDTDGAGGTGGTSP